MSLPSFLRFKPVPLKARHDAWSPELQFRFILGLARGVRPEEAARSLGMSRQGAYALRKRPGAEGFAAAWDEALRYARRVRVERARRAAPASVQAPEHRSYREYPAPARPSPARRSAQRAAFDALLDRLYPRQAAKADKMDKADGKPM